MTRRRARRGPPQCKDCHRIIRWLCWSHNGHWRTFEPRPVDSRTQHAVAYPVEGNRVWRFRELVEDLMVRRRVSESEAQAEAHDMPWHVPHTCTTPNTPEGDTP